MSVSMTAEFAAVNAALAAGPRRWYREMTGAHFTFLDPLLVPRWAPEDSAIAWAWDEWDQDAPAGVYEVRIFQGEQEVPGCRAATSARYGIDAAADVAAAINAAFDRARTAYFSEPR